MLKLLLFTLKLFNVGGLVSLLLLKDTDSLDIILALHFKFSNFISSFDFYSVEGELTTR